MTVSVGFAAPASAAGTAAGRGEAGRSAGATALGAVSAAAFGAAVQSAAGAFSGSGSAPASAVPTEPVLPAEGNESEEMPEMEAVEPATVETGSVETESVETAGSVPVDKAPAGTMPGSYPQPAQGLAGWYFHVLPAVAGAMEIPAGVDTDVDAGIGEGLAAGAAGEPAVTDTALNRVSTTADAPGTGALPASSLFGPVSGTVAAATAVAAAAAGAPAEGGAVPAAAAAASGSGAAAATASASDSVAAPREEPVPAPLPTPAVPSRTGAEGSGRLSSGSPLPAGGAGAATMSGLPELSGMPESVRMSSVASGQPGWLAAPEASEPVSSPAPVPVAAPLTAASVSSTAAVPPAAAPAAPAHTAQLVNQLSQPLVRLAAAAPGEHMITLSVDPESLGPVTVRAHISSDGVRVEIFAPNDTGREALRHILADLRRDLAGGGAGGNTSLSLSDHNQPGDGSGGRPQNPEARSAGRHASELSDRSPDTGPALPPLDPAARRLQTHHILPALDVMA